jgi:hypothetical protein
LHCILDELIKRVELLTHKTFLVEETRNNGPAILLRDLLITFFFYAIVRILIIISFLCGTKISGEVEKRKINRRVALPWLISMEVMEVTEL